MLSHRGRLPPHPKLIISHLQGPIAHKNGHIYLTVSLESFAMTSDVQTRLSALQDSLGH